MIKRNTALYFVCLIGLVVRVAFIIYGAKIYFGRENIFVDGDTRAWGLSIENLIHQGVYTVNPGHEYGYFGRMPGFSFFMGIFYLLAGQNWNLTYILIGWFQTFLDVAAIVLVYKIALRLFASDRNALVAALLYALYPFVIVWTPVVYSEYMSIFFMLTSLYFLTHSERRFYLGWCGFFLGISVLFRPQLLVFIPIVGIYLLFKYRKNIYLMLTRGALFALTILLTYGLWPIRNYVNHQKIILTQDLRGIENWNVDVLSFRQYIYSVKPEWDPQFKQIVTNQYVEMPAEAYAVKEDSALVDSVIRLSKNCGSGFSYWRGYWKNSFDKPNCNEEIANIYNKLRVHVIQHDPFHYYVTLPLLNLKKALFKISLNDTSTVARKIASLLFVYRSLLIVFGLIGCVVMLLQKHKAAWFALMTLFFFVVLYVWLCAGTGTEFRNIEVRYFIHPDVLLLFPAAWLIGKWLSRSGRSTNTLRI